MRVQARWRRWSPLALSLCLTLLAAPLRAQTAQTLILRGHRQVLHLYGQRGGVPVIVSSGDGGWLHLAPHVAELLAARGFFVVGFDVKTYLESFTSKAGALRPADEPSDYRVLLDFAREGSTRKPILVGVSEGAGLSVLAATDPEVRNRAAGVIGLGLPDMNELGWRWKDALIYVTHGRADEPSFSTAMIVGSMAPLPLAAIHSTHDEFVPVDEVQKILEHANGPKRLWIVQASNHRFSNNLEEFDQRLLEAFAWVAQNASS